MKNSFFFTLLFLFIQGETFAQKWPDIQNPPAKPELFAPGLISSSLSERDFALSPDGKVLFYTLQSAGGVFQTIVYREKKKNGTWSEPKRAPFCGNRSDLEPAFSPDGKRLFFASNRTRDSLKSADFDIYMVDIKNGIWSAPANLGSPVNTDKDEFYPSVSTSGNLYFTATYANGIGKEDIWMSRFENGQFVTPTVLDSMVNSKTYEFNAFVLPDESALIFTSYGRKDDSGRGDLYISRKDKNGTWMAAENLKQINSPALDYCPFVSPDGKTLFFTSERNNLSELNKKPGLDYTSILKILTEAGNGFGDLYWVKF